MIRHICMFKLKNENKAANLAEMLERAQTLKSIEQIKKFEVVCNGEDMPQDNYDVSLIFDFANAADLQTYQQHPIHKAFGAFMGQIRELRACIDYYFEA